MRFIVAFLLGMVLAAVCIAAQADTISISVLRETGC